MKERNKNTLTHLLPSCVTLADYCTGALISFSFMYYEKVERNHPSHANII